MSQLRISPDQMRQRATEYKNQAGIVDGAVINAAEVNALASLPSREVLLAKLLGSMKSPISGTVGVLSGVIRNAVYVLDAVRQKKEKEQGAA